METKTTTLKNDNGVVYEDKGYCLTSEERHHVEPGTVRCISDTLYLASYVYMKGWPWSRYREVCWHKVRLPKPEAAK